MAWYGSKLYFLDSNKRLQNVHSLGCIFNLKHVLSFNCSIFPWGGEGGEDGFQLSKTN